MNCPWSHYEPATLRFCEKELCSIIAQPANTWTNIGFILVGLYILSKEYSTNKLLSLVGVIAIIVGIGSTLFHMSGTFMFEVFDLFGMFLISSLMVCLNLWRLYPRRVNRIIGVFVVLNILSLILLLMIKPIGVAVFATQIYIGMSLELVLFAKKDKYDYKYLIIMAGAFAISYAFWALDINKIVCIPDNHYLTGHGVWHFINAFAIFCLYKFHKQFQAEDIG